jgi:hypothetical protein
MEVSTQAPVQSTVEPIRLGYDNTMVADVIPAMAKAFGHLVRLAAPVMTSYHGDLYHDALWLHGRAHGRAFAFYWSVNESGTSIGLTTGALNRTHGYRVIVWLDERYRTWLTVTPAGRDPLPAAPASAQPADEAAPDTAATGAA